jgi:hypothetical protein
VVVDLLAAEFKGLKTFATLSPSRVRPWLERALSDGEPRLLLPAERNGLKQIADGSRGARRAQDTDRRHRHLAQDPAVTRR